MVSRPLAFARPMRAGADSGQAQVSAGPSRSAPVRETPCPDDDPLARQRQIIAWHPLRALNAINVRVPGADLLTVHVQLSCSSAIRSL